MSNSTTWKMLVTNNKYVLCFNGASKPQTPSALKWMIFIKLACGHLTCFTIWHVLVKVKMNYLIRAYNMTFVGGFFFGFGGFFFCFYTNYDGLLPQEYVFLKIAAMQAHARMALLRGHWHYSNLNCSTMTKIWNEMEFIKR